MQIPGKLLQGEVVGPSSLRPGGGLGLSEGPLALLWTPPPPPPPSRMLRQVTEGRAGGRKKTLGTPWSGMSLDWVGRGLSSQVL